MLNLPLYSTTEKVAIGIDVDRTLSIGSEEIISKEKPVVFYGTSLTQGGSASRPGYSYTAQLSRSLNREVINLGFAGNGKFEKSVGDILCTLDAEIFEIDCTPNASPTLIRKSVIPFITQLRECKPHTPIYIIETIQRDYAKLNHGDIHDQTSYRFNKAQNKELKNAFDSLLGMGISELYYFSNDQLIDPKSESTVDGIHLSDLGHTEVSKKLSLILKKHIF